MQKRLRFLPEEIQLLDEAVRFYSAFLEQCDHDLDADEITLSGLKQDFRYTNDRAVFEKVQQLEPVVKRGITLAYGMRVSCLKALHRRLSQSPQGKKLHSGNRVHLECSFAPYVPVETHEIAYWVKRVTGNHLSYS